MKNCWPSLSAALCALMTFFFTATAFADTARFSVLSFRPHTDKSDFFGIYQSNSLDALTAQVGMAFDYARLPLKATIAATEYQLIKYMVVQHAVTAFGLTDWLEFSLNLPIIWANRFTDPDTLAPASTTRSMGDLQVELKMRLLNGEEHPIGIAFAPFITVPTGNEAEFVGNDGATGGGRLVFDALFKERYALALNIGALARKHFNAYSVDLHHQFLLGLGAAVRVQKNVSVSGEVETSTPFSDFFNAQETTPLELRAGVKWNVKGSGLTLGASGAGGLIYGTGVPRYRALATLGYTFGGRQHGKAARINHEKVEAKYTEQKVVYFSFNSARLTQQAKTTLNDFAALLKEKKQESSILIQGYCDSLGATSYNQRLSERRARAVYQHLQAQDVNNAQMSYEGKGELPVQSSVVEERLNRKVEILASW